MRRPGVVPRGPNNLHRAWSGPRSDKARLRGLHGTARNWSQIGRTQRRAWLRADDLTGRAVRGFSRRGGTPVTLRMTAVRRRQAVDFRPGGTVGAGRGASSSRREDSLRSSDQRRLENRPSRQQRLPPRSVIRRRRPQTVGRRRADIIGHVSDVACQSPSGVAQARSCWCPSPTSFAESVVCARGDRSILAPLGNDFGRFAVRRWDFDGEALHQQAHAGASRFCLVPGSGPACIATTTRIWTTTPTRAKASTCIEAR